MSVYPPTEIAKTATLSPDGQYRYRLERRWGEGKSLIFVGLNPSTADAAKDDNTIRRCVGFARSHGCDALVMLNLYAYRSTSPKGLWLVDDPVGPENDEILSSHLRRAHWDRRPVIAAWGGNAKRARVEQVLAMPGAAALHALSTTRQGAPGHPLYIPATARAKPWSTPWIA